MATMAVSSLVVASLPAACSRIERFSFPSDCSVRLNRPVLPSLRGLAPRRCGYVVACLPSNSESEAIDPTKLYVSGLSFRTNEDGLRNAFGIYGQLVEVNLVMDRIANRPRGYAFLRYSTEEEAKKAIEGMHGKSFCKFPTSRGNGVLNLFCCKPHLSLNKGRHQDMFLDGRVIFVEICKPRSRVSQRTKRRPLQY